MTGGSLRSLGIEYVNHYYSLEGTLLSTGGHNVNEKQYLPPGDLQSRRRL